jgi:hypothetical protein
VRTRRWRRTGESPRTVCVSLRTRTETLRSSTSVQRRAPSRGAPVSPRLVQNRPGRSSSCECAGTHGRGGDGTTGAPHLASPISGL